MYKKFISSILVVALLNLFGCYSFQPISVPENKQVERKEGKQKEIIVKTKDSQEYLFSDYNYYIENDTLYGKGISLLSYDELPYEGNFALGEIKSIQFQDFNELYPSLITVSQYQKIEAERGKPSELYLTKNDLTRYSFMKNDYHIKNDTLYGKGKLILEGGQQLDRNIALANIESIEVDSFNTLNTVLLVLGIVGIVALSLYILLLIFPPNF